MIFILNIQFTYTFHRQHFLTLYLLKISHAVCYTENIKTLLDFKQNFRNCDFNLNGKNNLKISKGKSETVN
jgi:hypothetical protein